MNIWMDAPYAADDPMREQGAGGQMRNEKQHQPEKRPIGTADAPYAADDPMREMGAGGQMRN